MSPVFRALVAAERGGQGILIADTETGVVLPTEHVDTLTALDNLFRAGSELVLVGWEIDATVNCWVNELPDEPRARLAASLWAEWQGYRMLYVPGRFLDVRRYTNVLDTRGKRRRVRDRRTLYDLASFWPGRRAELVPIAAEWSIIVPTIVATGDAARPYEFAGWTRSAIVEWAATRATVVCHLAASLATSLAGIGLRLGRWHGVGAIGTELLKAAGGDRWVARYSPRRQPIVDGQLMLPLFLAAYYGGRIETTVAGSFDAPSWRLDLRSAYPWALSWLGPVGFRWQHVTAFDPSPAARMSLYRVRWSVPSAWLGPFPYREPAKRATVYPQHGEGWYWWPEVRAALTLHGPSAIEIIEGYVSPNSSLRPLLVPMASWYRTRRQLEAEHDPLAAVVKGGMNAVYGKLAQTAGANGRTGQYYNPALAGWTCSAVRARLLTAIGADDSHVAAIMTDGYLHTDEPPASLLSDQLGGWRSERFERAELVIPGLYRLHRSDGTVAVASTGVNRSLDFDRLLSELTARQRATVQGRWFVPHIVADLWPDRWDQHRCRWLDSSPTVNPWVLARKRQGIARLVAGFDWRSELHALGPWHAGGDGLSAPYPGPACWSDAYDPLLESAKAALSQAS